MSERVVKVLIVDDHASIREHLGRLLVRWFRVSVGEAASLREGRQRFAEMRPEVAFVDIGLPDGNGLILASEIATQRRVTRVFVMTASDAEQYREAAARVGAAGCLSKSDLYQQVIPAVREALVEVGEEASVTVWCRVAPLVWLGGRTIWLAEAASAFRRAVSGIRIEFGEPMLPLKMRAKMLLLADMVGVLVMVSMPLMGRGA